MHLVHQLSGALHCSLLLCGSDISLVLEIYAVDTMFYVEKKSLYIFHHVDNYINGIHDFQRMRSIFYMGEERIRWASD